MIVDSSALIAILTGENDAEVYARAIAESSVVFIPAPSYLETCMVYCGKRLPETHADVDALLRATSMEIRDFDSEAAQLAVTAFLVYGKGRHKAGLNFGDCMSYAVSKLEAMPLLFKGDDFRLTDVECAI